MKLLTGTLKEGLCEEDFHKLMCVYTVYIHTKPLKLFVGPFCKRTILAGVRLGQCVP